MKYLLVLLACILLFCSFVKKVDESSSRSKQNDRVSLIFAGDIMGHSFQYKAAYDPNTDTFNYDVCFKAVKPYLESSDFAMANLEVPLAGPPYSGYPNFSSPDALLDAMKLAGYNIILTANNHILDFGKPGLERTISTIKNRKLMYAGSYINEQQRDSTYPLILEKKGVRIALLNCTYLMNTMAVTPPNRVNGLDTIEIKNDIRRAQAKGVDLIIVTVHWGIEYQLEASAQQKEYTRFFSRQGVNLVIGSHPHVVQNEDIVFSKDSLGVPVFYSLGNSISNQRKPNTDGGIMVKVEIDAKSAMIVKSSVIPVYIHKGLLNGVYQYHLIPTTEYIQDPSKYLIDAPDQAALLFFDRETRKRLSNIEVFK